MHRPRVILGGLFHETHTFIDGLTRWSDFQCFEGKAILDQRDQPSPLGTAVKTGLQHGWEIVPTIFVTAVPSAVVADEVLEIVWNRFLQIANPAIEQGVDGIFLVLHSSCVCQSVLDVEGELLARIRALPNASHLPIYGVYDLHSNYSPAMAALSNCLVAYRENPHTDACEATRRAVDLMQRMFQDHGKQVRAFAKQFHAPAPVVWAPIHTGSQLNPMRRLLSLARQLETDYPEFLVVNVNAGFAFSDTPDTGTSFTIATLGDESTARAALDQLVELATRYAPESSLVESPLLSTLENIARQQNTAGHHGLTVLVEPAENIGAGAPGDGTTLLQGLLQFGIQNAAVCLWDPLAVRELSNAEPGGTRTLTVGGRGSKYSGEPLRIECTVNLLCDGNFELRDKHSHLASMSGNRFDMGRCALVRVQGVSVLLTTNRTPPMDLGQWFHVGIDPSNLSVIGVKAAVAHRQAYDPIATQQIWVDSPGPCQSELARFNYQNIRRPIYPLDPIIDRTVAR